MRVEPGVKDDSALVEFRPGDGTENVEPLHPDQNLFAYFWKVAPAQLRAIDADVFHDDRFGTLNRHSRSDDEDRPPLFRSAVARNTDLLAKTGHRIHSRMPTTLTKAKVRLRRHDRQCQCSGLFDCGTVQLGTGNNRNPDWSALGNV